jgi:predicted transcriptional regulator
MRARTETVLDLDSRRRILEGVQAHPGLHLRALAHVLGMPLSTLEYHCYLLVRQGHLATRESGKFKAFFPPEGIDRRDKDILYMVRRDGLRRICAHLVLHPGTTPGELKEALAISGPTLSFHLNKLRASSLLREERQWRVKRLYVEDAERVANVLWTHRRSLRGTARPAARAPLSRLPGGVKGV